ncbi:thiol:disulfide interchange protein TlpA [Limoniibacter endophyticus]|uniref:Sodium:dicarboxylate symporter n=1 Tax=Limoniibacter endophyticus TaxID=1565040 RepID=A0A8J3GGH0_9HYPH|nr:TlpA disulfide reductase family protein [Limoniibacter endophyticus]GHC72957.1 sodium:dicarboxylate symporter [Limoniibacter endophyticus]
MIFKKLTPATLAILAAVAGLSAGAVAVYVNEAPSGNQIAGTSSPSTPPPVVTVAETGSEEDKACLLRSGELAEIAKTAQGEVAAMLAADPVQAVGDLSFNSPEGDPMKIGDLRDQTLLVNLWATWCAPCRAEMPALDALQGDLGGKDFSVIAVNVDTGGDEKPKGFLREIGNKNLAYYRDNTLGIFNELKSRGLALGLPVTLLVDREGCLIGSMNGPAEWNSRDAKALIMRAMGR